MYVIRLRTFSKNKPVFINSLKTKMGVYPLRLKLIIKSYYSQIGTRITLFPAKLMQKMQIISE